MKDSKSYFHPETIRKIARLELRSKHIVEGFLSGMHRSPFFGQSIEFRQHRDYVYGDDLRHVDWKVWARQDRLYIKQFEEDTNLACHLLVDCSESMEYGSGSFSKFDYAATIATCIAYLIVRQKDVVGCTLFSDSIKQHLPTSNRSNQLQTIANTLHQTSLLEESGEKTDIGKVLAAFAGQLDHRGLVVVISDFFSDADSIAKGLRFLRQRGHDVLAIQVMDEEELNFNFSGPTRFEGMELDAELKCNPAALRDSYLDAVENFLHQMKKNCAKAECDYALVSTQERFDAVLSKLLSRRMARQR